MPVRSSNEQTNWASWTSSAWEFAADTYFNTPISFRMAFLHYPARYPIFLPRLPIHVFNFFRAINFSCFIVDLLLFVAYTSIFRGILCKPKLDEPATWREQQFDADSRVFPASFSGSLSQILHFVVTLVLFMSN